MSLRAIAAVSSPSTRSARHSRSRAALAGLAGPDTEVTEVRPLGAPARGGDRAHVRARFAGRMTDRRTGESADADIVAEGAGLGYLGRPGVAVAAALPGYVPHVYGFTDGFVYRDWLPAAAGPAPGDALARTIAGYVAARQRALPAPSASVNRLGGRNPAWEVAARRLSGQYGPFAVASRPLLLEPAVRRLLVPGQQAVPDGKTDARHWLPGPAGGLGQVGSDEPGGAGDEVPHTS